MNALRILWASFWMSAWRKAMVLLNRAYWFAMVRASLHEENRSTAILAELNARRKLVDYEP